MITLFDKEEFYIFNVSWLSPVMHAFGPLKSKNISLSNKKIEYWSLKGKVTLTFEDKTSLSFKLNEKIINQMKGPHIYRTAFSSLFFSHTLFPSFILNQTYQRVFCENKHEAMYFLNKSNKKVTSYSIETNFKSDNLPTITTSNKCR